MRRMLGKGDTRLVSVFGSAAKPIQKYRAGLRAGRDLHLNCLEWRKYRAKVFSSRGKITEKNNNKSRLCPLKKNKKLLF